MRLLQLPTVRFQQQSQLANDSCHSLLISLLRGMAALQVALAHLRAEMFPSLRAIADPPLYFQALAFGTGFGHQAVVVFFLISGWLVGGSLLNKFGQPQAVGAYAIDRLTRLWTVLVPTFAMMLLAALAMGTVVPEQSHFSEANEYSALSFVGNMFGLQTLMVKNFGGNDALWSLAYESWYYLLFPLLLTVLLGRGFARAASFVAIVALAALLPYALTLYFSIWLLGAAFSRIRIDCSRGARLALLALTAAAAVYYRFKGSNDDLVPASFVQDLICSLPLLALLASLHMKADPASRPLRRLGAFARFFSEFSFTLYVLHLPAIAVLRHVGRNLFGRDRLMPDSPLDYAIYFGMAAILVAAAGLSYLMFESHTFRIRRLLKNLLLGRPAARPAGVATAAE